MLMKRSCPRRQKSCLTMLGKLVLEEHEPARGTPTYSPWGKALWVRWPPTHSHIHTRAHTHSLQGTVWSPLYWRMKHSIETNIMKCISFRYKCWSLTCFPLKKFFFVAQVGMQWCRHGSLESWSPKLKGSFCLSFPSGWDYRSMPLCSANFLFFL